jgi:sec-independent protein translocase protein TatC
MSNPSTTTQPQNQGQPLMEHLVELRSRLARAAIGVLIGMVVGFVLVLPDGPVELIDIIIRQLAPINPDYAPLLSTGTAETFTSYMKTALAVGIILAMPLIVYQLIAFIAPGLKPAEKRYIYLALPFVTAFFIGGLSFGWFITVPTAVRFLIGFSDSALIQVQPTISDFLNIVTMLLLINGIVFELPIIIYVLAVMGLTSARQLSQYRRYAMITVVIVAAIITPTGDPINLALLAIPMYMLYELGIILARFAPRRTDKA